MSVTPNEKAVRIAADIKRVKDYDNWPWKTYMPVHSQPWVSKEYGGGRTGVIILEDPAAVRAWEPMGVIGQVIEKFESVEALCNKWSVD